MLEFRIQQHSHSPHFSLCWAFCFLHLFAALQLGMLWESWCTGMADAPQKRVPISEIQAKKPSLSLVDLWWFRFVVQVVHPAIGTPALRMCLLGYCFSEAAVGRIWRLDTCKITPSLELCSLLWSIQRGQVASSLVSTGNRKQNRHLLEVPCLRSCGVFGVWVFCFRTVSDFHPCLILFSSSCSSSFKQGETTSLKLQPEIDIATTSPGSPCTPFRYACFREPWLGKATPFNLLFTLNIFA